MKCKYCGKDLNDNARFCDGCGASVESKKEEVKQSNNDNNSGGSKIGIIIISIIVLIGIIVGIVLLTVGNKDNSNKEKNNENNSNENNNENNSKSTDYVKNIKYEEYLLDDGTLFIIATNNNDKVMHIGAKMITYDADGKKVYDVYASAYPVAPGETAVLEQNIDQWPYETYKVEIEAEEDDVETPHWKDLTIKDTDDGNGVILNVTNNANEAVKDLNIGIVFYKDGKPVALEMRSLTGNNPLEVGQTKEEDFYPYDHESKRIKYDSYKIYFNNAGTRKTK